MTEINKRIENLKQWRDAYDTLIQLCKVGDYLTVYNFLLESKKEYDNEIKKLEQDGLKDRLDILKIEIDCSLAFNNKGNFMKSTSEYNKLKKG